MTLREALKQASIFAAVAKGQTPAATETQVDWKTASPRQTQLNLSITKETAFRFKRLGIVMQQRGWTEQQASNSALIRTGTEAGVRMAGRSHQNAAGLRVSDNGLEHKLQPADGTKMALDRIWYDLVHRLGMILTGLWVQEQDADRGNKKYKLKVRFEKYRDNGVALRDFFEGYLEDGMNYYQNKPEETKGISAEAAAADDVAQVKAIVHEVQKRLYDFVWFYRNPNLSWTFNTGGAYSDKVPEHYTRIRITSPTNVDSVRIKSPKFRQNTVAPPKRGPRTATVIQSSSNSNE